MGLDMYAMSTSAKLARAVDFGEPDAIEMLHYWRQHPNLHGWMQELYRAKGGLNDEFNLSSVMLESTDLDRLEASIIASSLPETDGCFFGYSDGSERDSDLLFIAKARAAIAAGKTIYYVAWW